MAVNGISTPAVAAAGVGALVVWSALKGTSVTGGLRSLLGGQQPSTTNVQPAGGISLVKTGGSSQTQYPNTEAINGATGSAIADDAMLYYGSGTKYAWGGGSPKGWDCSGFCNWVIGHDLGLSIPGSRSGNYTGHGPTTLQWAVFGRGVPAGQEQPGDLVVWPTQHMGIVIGNGQMINCPGPNGTPAPVVGTYNWGSHVFRRISTAGLATGTTQAPGTTTAGGRG